MTILYEHMPVWIVNAHCTLKVGLNYLLHTDATARGRSFSSGSGGWCGPTDVHSRICTIILTHSTIASTWADCTGTAEDRIGRHVVRLGSCKWNWCPWFTSWRSHARRRWEIWIATIVCSQNFCKKSERLIWNWCFGMGIGVQKYCNVLFVLALRDQTTDAWMIVNHYLQHRPWL